MRERDFLRQTVDRLVQLVSETEEAHALERSEWAAERTRLLNALLAKNSADFTLRQKMSVPEPISDVPREAREAQPQPMGL